ncbi:RNA methyltransferase [Coralloluteibacterium stylophorae]|uniref:tRNA (cytidine/uridine-2'-O-)-methyltransferase TrmJ n=1 Tax=Coralloluteibacterium stylophorae TaxID=1776034 RepID=A0A8J8AXF3_9GAMM|nr:RNA methyltransferase [Coralloluteibacterium stylophorae]MBS7456193.1 RNA methyltransferase [Coralloluteibacterium stylophorae]
MSHDIRFVLVGTQHPGNIGAAARAMKTMALARMSLVEPPALPDRDADAMAAGATDLIDAAPRFDDLPAALADCVTVFGCTARSRRVQLPELTPREAVPRILEAARRGPVALVFGRERTGLTNDELMRCDVAIHIPSNPEFSSLNLAASVQVLAYELRLGLLAEGAAPVTEVAGEEGEGPAPQAELENFFVHLDQALHDIDFHKKRAPDTVMRRLRRLFARAKPESRELRILRGILADAQRMARLAGEDARSR